MPAETTSERADSIPDSRRRAVSKWISEIKKDKLFWSKDFDRMKENMNFLAGIQRKDQKTIDDERYTANITLQVVNEKEAALYARNPTIVARRRDTLDFQIWDGRSETLQPAIMSMQQTMMAQQQGIPAPVNVQAMALVMDYMHGMQVREQVEKVGKTLEIGYKYYCDNLSPDFKEQMKGLVRRVLTCGVAYVRQEFIREYESLPAPTGTTDTMHDTLLHAKSLMQKIVDEDITDDSDPRMEQLRLCMQSLSQDSQQQAMAAQPQGQMQESLTFLFPKSRSIIADRKCTDLVGFVGADHVTEVHMWNLSYVNSYFETNIELTSSGMHWYGESGTEIELKNQGTKAGVGEEGGKCDPIVCVFETYDKITKCRLWTCDGWPDYLHEPEAVQPLTKHFWPWFGLVFNKVETDSETETTAIGPSDVQQMKHPQMEWNRTRESLRVSRQAGAPRWAMKAGALTEEDVSRIMSLPENGVVSLQGLQDGVKVSDVLQPIPVNPIQPGLYDSTPLMLDVQLTTGQSSNNLNAKGAGGKKETATAASIQEQSRMSKSGSNVDDLDGLLTRLAQNGAELLLYEAQAETIKRICGPGAVWPVSPEARSMFAHQLYLEVEAASSGRPNQALEVSNYERLIPFLIQLGANPKFLVKEGVKRLSDKIDLDEAFPLVPPQNVSPQQPLFNDAQQPQGQQAQQPGNGGQHQSSQNPQGANGQPPVAQPPQQQMMPPGPMGQMGIMPGASPVPPQGQMRQ